MVGQVDFGSHCENLTEKTLHVHTHTSIMWSLFKNKNKTKQSKTLPSLETTNQLFVLSEEIRNYFVGFTIKFLFFPPSLHFCLYFYFGNCT